jgi:hypothetical protein
MRKRFRKLAVLSLLFATAASAHSGFRQRIREMTGGFHIWLRDDGSVVTEIDCTLREQEKLDGGTWPLKNPTAIADGGLPNPVFNSCARLLEAQNGFDGGLL